MIELADGKRGYRQLLATVSSLVLVAALQSRHEVLAQEGSGKTSVWIELGGQLERMEGGQQPFAASFTPQTDQAGLFSPSSVERLSRFGTGFEGKVEVEPGDGAWAVSASVRYGRSTRKQRQNQEIDLPSGQFPSLGGGSVTRTPEPNFENVIAKTGESHLIVDFKAGKDVGLGAFGNGAKSLLSLGVRFAEFSGYGASNLYARPDSHLATVYIPIIHRPFYGLQFNHLDQASAESSRSFRGIGPSLSWASSIPIAGDADSLHVDVDVEGNAAVLFGRQKVRSRHQTTSRYYYFVSDALPPYKISTAQSSDRSLRSHSVVVPNLGGSIGMSFGFSAAKLSVGYRGDFFLGAVDGGFDTRQSRDRNFYGPFATVNIKLGG